MPLWFGVSSGSKGAGCWNVCSHFQFLNFILWKDECSWQLFICHRLSCVCSVDVGEHWPAEKANVIKHRLSGFIQYCSAIVVLIVNLLSKLYKTRMPLWSQRTTREQPPQLPLSLNANWTFLWWRWSIHKAQNTNSPYGSTVTTALSGLVRSEWTAFWMAINIPRMVRTLQK